MRFLKNYRKCQIVILLGIVSAIAAPAQTFNDIAMFDGSNGKYPDYVNLTQGRDGSFYGTTLEGGPDNSGTVFKINTAGMITTLYAFHGFHGTDGGAPMTGLALNNNGYFYGTTSSGGAIGWGTAFRIDPAGRLTTLHSFDNFTDGNQPLGLVIGHDGNIYGATYNGGITNLGTIFKITVRGEFTTLHTFVISDGSYPSTLMEGTDGNFYGVTRAGGHQDQNCTTGCGTIFKITPAGDLTTIHKFHSADGANPVGPLTLGSDGSLYGTTSNGGSLCFTYCGTVFKIDTTGKLMTLHSFSGPDGGLPVAALVQATDGNFYGTTQVGGNTGLGTVFELAGNTLTTLHDFDGTDGSEPSGGLLQATTGKLYGTALTGGTCCGTVFSLDLGLEPFVTFVRDYGKSGQTGGILGQGFTGTSSVSLNGTPASFTVVSDTYIRATVPAGATTGFVTVTTPSGTLTSNVPFRVIP